VLHLGVARQLNHTVELNFGADNLTNRYYWDTQNYFESRIAPNAPVIARIHATPGYPLIAGQALSCDSAENNAPVSWRRTRLRQLVDLVRFEKEEPAEKTQVPEKEESENS